MARIFSISEVARATGVAAKTIRYYEEIGVLPAPSRTVSGYRQYDEPGAQRLRFIRHRIAELQLLQGELERVLRRPLASDHECRAMNRIAVVSAARDKIDNRSLRCTAHTLNTALQRCCVRLQLSHRCVIRLSRLWIPRI